jgi:hypothetical protein
MKAGDPDVSSGRDGRFGALRGWLAGLSPWTRRMVIGGMVVSLLGAWYLIVVVVTAALSDRERDWGAPVGPIVGSFLGVSLVLWLQRRRLGSRQRVREYRRALKKGRLPDDADPEVWRVLLAREKRVHDRASRRAQVFIGLGVVAWLVIAALYDYGPLGWALVLLGGALAWGLMQWAGQRQGRRIGRLREQFPSVPTMTD